MSLLGIHLSLWMGPTLAVPVPYSIAEALTSVEVTHNDTGPSGFQLTFQVGRSGPLDLLDYGLLKNPLIRPFVRVILLVRFAVVPQVLMDGIITQVNLSPGEEPGTSTLTVTGEDVSVMMDLKQEQSSHDAMSDYFVVLGLLSKYGDYKFIPPPPPALNPQALIPSNPLERRTPRVANLTDRAFIKKLAQQYGFLFYVTPGPAPFVNTVHWGPPERLSVPQRALSVNMGPATNIESINFRFDAMLPNEVIAQVDGEPQTFSKPSGMRAIPLARNQAKPHRQIFLTDYQMTASDQRKPAVRAQSLADESFDNVVTATGQLDALRYNGLLNPHGLVGLRGVGQTYDGFYYVKTVSHSISKGRYTQNFSLSREGTGATTPLIPP